MAFTEGMRSVASLTSTGQALSSDCPAAPHLFAEQVIDAV